MKKLLLLGLLALALLLVVRYITKGTRQYQIATSVSKLELPSERNLELIDFKEKWNEQDGTGYIYAIYQLSESDMKALVMDAQNKDYKKLPQDAPWRSGKSTHWPGVKNGLHFLSNDEVSTDKKSLKLSLLDLDKNYLIIYIEVT